MTSDELRIAYLTAGAAGMYCGSCLRDNALVAALTRQGVQATLIPMYTPIQTDESDVSIPRVFFGGINVYLQQRWSLFRLLPASWDRWLDQPWLIRRLARDGGTPSPRILGEMTLSMLRGSHGHQRKEVAQLTDWLRDELNPQLINLTNVLIAGCVPDLKQAMKVPVVVTLQGDDAFLSLLTDSDRDRAIALIQQLAEQVDAFIVFNRWYAEYMQAYLGLPASKFHVVPLGIHLDDFARFIPRPAIATDELTIGYLARLAPEKGLHLLVDAFIQLHQEWNMSNTRLLLAGWLGQQDRAYAEQQFDKLRRAGLADASEYLGAVDRQQKLDFLSRLHVLSVPTEFQDPKGLYVLEALAAGVPVVQPAHGAFPELLASTEGGCLVKPHDANDLATRLQQLLVDPDECQRLGAQARGTSCRDIPPMSWRPKLSPFTGSWSPANRKRSRTLSPVSREKVVKGPCERFKP